MRDEHRADLHADLTKIAGQLKLKRKKRWVESFFRKVRKVKKGPLPQP